jgi:hypothetical protein
MPLMNCLPHEGAWMRDSTYYRDDGSGQIEVADRHVAEACLRGWTLPLPAAPGIIYADRIVASADKIALPNGSAVNVMSTPPLPAGQWVIDGEVWFNVDAGTPSIQQLVAAIVDTSLLIPTDPAIGYGVNLMEVNQSRSAGTQVGFVLPVSAVYVPVTDPLVYYLVAYATWTGTGSLSAYGKLSGRMTANPTT